MVFSCFLCFVLLSIGFDSQTNAQFPNGNAGNPTNTGSFGNAGRPINTGSFGSPINFGNSGSAWSGPDNSGTYPGNTGSFGSDRNSGNTGTFGNAGIFGNRWSGGAIGAPIKRDCFVKDVKAQPNLDLKRFAAGRL